MAPAGVGSEIVTCPGESGDAVAAMADVPEPGPAGFAGRGGVDRVAPGAAPAILGRAGGAGGGALAPADGVAVGAPGGRIVTCPAESVGPAESGGPAVGRPDVPAAGAAGVVAGGGVDRVALGGALAGPARAAAFAADVAGLAGALSGGASVAASGTEGSSCAPAGIVPGWRLS